MDDISEMISRLRKNLILSGLIILFSQSANAACTILNSKEQPITPYSDPISLLLSSDAKCPDDVFKFRRLIQDNGLVLENTMVANRGYHNPSEGSFSVFEMVTGKMKQLAINKGDFFFGHFTDVDSQGNLIADQNAEKNSLMIEAFAWDDKKGFFNFYELRGNGTVGQWFYRGDSLDIVSDNTLLHRQLDPKHPVFGERLRCSACHDNGGPIMKELYQPHNDWWEPIRKLDFGGRNIDSALKNILKNLVPADDLAKAVQQGVKKLYQSNLFYSHTSTLTLQEQLRPLFCPQELNFKSDIVSNDDKNAEVIIPAEFFVDSRLLSSTTGVTIERSHYESALTALDSHFPETTLQDADHAWLVPVKAKSDKIAIDNLITRGVIDAKFAADVLDIDMTSPVVSTDRCGLLKSVPNENSSNWREIFLKNLSKSSDTTAKQLIANLNNPDHTVEYYKNKSEKFINQCRVKLKNNANVEMMMRLLIQRRAEIRTSEISANPKGQILEPGFRVIFPDSSYTPTPGMLKLTSECDVSSAL